MRPPSLPTWAALAVLAAALLASVVTDVRSRRILNRVTVPALVLAVLLRAAAAPPGARGAQVGWALLGVLCCAGPAFAASLRGWMGMGDVKLLAVVGAALGFPAALTALVWIALAGGVQALVQIAWARARGEPGPRAVPYACAIAAGTAVAVLGSAAGLL